MTHSVDIIDGVEGHNDYKQAVCSCGWKGAKYYWTNSSQLTEVSRSKSDHLSSVVYQTAIDGAVKMGARL